MGQDKIAQILLRHGAVTEEQIQRALTRQKSRGGRIGSHLLYYRFVTEAQLVKALGEQIGHPGVCLEGRTISEDVLKRLPVEIVDEYLMLPFEYEPQTNTLHVAMADPANGAGIALARRSARARDLKVHVAVDSILRGVIAALYHKRGREVFVDQIIELPSLFSEEKAAPAAPVAVRAKPAAPRVLVVSGATFMRSFLVPIFQREGFELEMLCEPADIAAALHERTFEHILVARDMEERFTGWVRAGQIATPRTELSIFSSVSGALLDNPAPYKAMAGCVIRAVQQLAETRCAGKVWTPSYVLICEDLRNLAGELGLRRLAVDGLQIAAHLLIPGATAPTTRFVPGDAAPDPAALHFDDFNRSLEIAQALRFPWDVESCLVSFSHLIDNIAPNPHDHTQKVALAAQILALVWYRHAAFRDQNVPALHLTAAIRRQASRLAAPKVVETYVRMIEAGAQHQATLASQDPVLLVSEPNEVAQQLSVHLKYGGFRVVEVENLPAARQLVQRVQPKAVLINHQHYTDGALELCTWVKRATGAFVYAFSSLDKPSLVMELLDAGFDDVYVPPFNFNVIVTRIGRSLERGGALRPAGAAPSTEQGFRGTLAELPFVDLIQALGASQRSLRIDLTAMKGERAAIYLRRGQITHAVCGPVAGADAVYRIISWRDEGRFATASIVNYPPDNVTESNDTLLFEGCRLLDEARR
jgi:DNA-binding response OmpR family regulator